MFKYCRYLALVWLPFLGSICSDECPNIVTRGEWNASKPLEIRPLRENPPPYVVVHHSATSTCQTKEECLKLVKNIQNYHMINHGWEDIGYNFLIGGDGNIYEGRSWGIHGAHVIKFNARSIGVCLLGNFEENEPPSNQLKALEELIKCAKNKNKILENYKLIGHRQGVATLCPGKFLFKVIKEWPHFYINPE